MPVSYPLINGIRFDYSSIECLIAGKRFVGLKSINYNDGLDPGLVRGTAAPVLGRTRGQYNAEGSFEIFREDFDDLTTLLVAVSGNGFMEVGFDISVVYSELSSAQVQQDIVIGSRIKKVDSSNTQGSDALTLKVDFHAMYLVRNGKFPLSVPATFSARF